MGAVSVVLFAAGFTLQGVSWYLLRWYGHYIDRMDPKGEDGEFWRWSHHADAIKPTIDPIMWTGMALIVAGAVVFVMGGFLPNDPAP